MTVQSVLAPLSAPLPRLACPTQLGIGDLVRFRDVELPVIVTGSELQDGEGLFRRVFPWISQARTSDRRPVLEGRHVPEPGETVLLLACGETVPAGEVRDEDVLLFEDRASSYGLVIGDPKLTRPDALDIAWTSGTLPTGHPQTIGFLQCDPSRLVRRAARFPLPDALTNVRTA